MSRVSDEALAGGLRVRKRPEVIEAEVRSTIMSQMSIEAVRLPVGQIKPSPFQVKQLDEKDIDDLMASIQDTGGLITPITVRLLDDGTYELVAGHTRYAAFVRLGYPDIPAVVRVMTDAEAAKALAADNHARADLSDYESYKQLKDLFEREFLKSNSEAARLFGRTRQDIIRFQSFGKLPAAVRELLDINKRLIGASAAYVLCDLPEELVIEGCQRLADGKLKSQQAVLLWIAQQSKPQAAPPVARSVLGADGKPAGRLTKGPNGVKLSVKNADYEAVLAVVQEELCRQGFKV